MIQSLQLLLTFLIELKVDSVDISLKDSRRHNSLLMF